MNNASLRKRVTGTFLLLGFVFSPTLWAFEKRPYIIAVAGGSASGKTFTARKIVEALGADRAILLSADNYFAPEKQACEFYLDGQINYDHPSAVDLAKLKSHLSYLRAGFPVQVKEYTFGKPVERDTWLTYAPADFVVVEGIFALDPRVADLADFRVFVDVDYETRFGRRLARDQAERGLTEEQVRAYFNRVVEPMHRRYIQPTALRADQIVESPNDSAKIKEIVRQVEEQARKMRTVKASILLNAYNEAIEQLVRANPGKYEVVDIDELFASQPELGFFRLSQKSATLDAIVQETALNPDKASPLKHYLESNPIPVLINRGDRVITDHHHLLMALYNKGIRRALTVPADEATVDPSIRKFIDEQNRRLHVTELRNNPYRSLVSLIQELGYIEKTGKAQEEFAWVAYLKERFETEKHVVIDERMILDPDVRDGIVKDAIGFAREARAIRLPGYIKSNQSR